MKVAKSSATSGLPARGKALAGYKLLIVQPINILDGSKEQDAHRGRRYHWSRCGRTVIIVGGSSAERGRGHGGPR